MGTCRRLRNGSSTRCVSGRSWRRCYSAGIATTCSASSSRRTCHRCPTSARTGGPPWRRPLPRWRRPTSAAREDRRRTPGAGRSGSGEPGGGGRLRHARVNPALPAAPDARDRTAAGVKLRDAGGAYTGLPGDRQWPGGRDRGRRRAPLRLHPKGGRRRSGPALDPVRGNDDSDRHAPPATLTHTCPGRAMRTAP